MWGAKKDGELTPEQIEINKQVLPVINELVRIVEISYKTKSQEYTIGYIIRGIIISKITYMIEHMKNKASKTNNESNDLSNNISAFIKEYNVNPGDSDSSHGFGKTFIKRFKRW